MDVHVAVLVFTRSGSEYNNLNMLLYTVRFAMNMAISKFVA